MGRIIFEERSRDYACLRRDQLLGKRDNTDDDQLLLPSVQCSFRPCRAEDCDLGQLDFLYFDRFRDQGRPDKLFFFFLFRILELSL